MNVSFRVGEFLIEPQLNSISNDGFSIRVEPKVMQVLVCLSDAADQVISKDCLIEKVWPDTFVSDDVLTRAISELRKAWRVPTVGGEEVLILDRPGAGEWGQWALAEDGIYFVNAKTETGYAVELFSFATQTVTPVIALTKANEFISGLAISPDRHQILYTQQDPINSDIMLVEDFR